MLFINIIAMTQTVSFFEMTRIRTRDLLRFSRVHYPCAPEPLVVRSFCMFKIYFQVILGLIEVLILSGYRFSTFFVGEAKYIAFVSVSISAGHRDFENNFSAHFLCRL